MDLIVPQRWVRPEIFHVEPGHWKKQLPTKHLEVAQKGDLARLEALLREHPEYLNKRGAHSRTLLWEATRAGKLAAARWLIEQGADVNATGCYNGESLVQISPYCAARYYRRPAIAEYLRDHGATEDVFRATFLGDRDRVERELAAKPDLVIAEDPNDGLYYTPLLSFAVAGGHARLVDFLIQRGAPIAQYSTQLLHLAARSTRDDLFDLLLANGADTRALGTNIFGIVSDLGFLHFLLSRGVSPIDRLGAQNSALAYVARGDKGERPDKVALLLDHGAKIDVAGTNGKTALHYAAAAGHNRVVRLLLDRGVDTSLADNDGFTALDLARASGRIDTVELLLTRAPIHNREV
jgi:ankyrin repeat protein